MNTERVEIAIKRYKALCRKHGMTLPELALAFLSINDLFVTSAIIGPSNVEQLEECVGALEKKLTEEMMREIDEIDAMDPNPCA